MTRAAGLLGVFAALSGCGESFAAASRDAGGAQGDAWGSGGASGTGGAAGAGAAGAAVSGGGSAGASHAGSGGTAGVLLEECPADLRGPALVLVPGASACMDRAEVTRASYEEFRAAPGASGTGPAGCAWNTDLTPVTYSMASRPVVGVDWCDAAAYCAWAGKRLCTPAERASACAHRYPYGDTYEPTSCVTQDRDGTPGVQATDALQPAGTPTCASGELLDLSGNAAEWGDDCTGASGDTDTCGAWGGGYLDGAEDSSCAARRTLARSSAPSDVGLRCCWSP
ncbi:MAG: SUMF1/EgtB/PvdO family nonheme iron enzyme [Polyangiaceae bacterium]|nr:SUMF1/EgtB/PvdO family nonheme iron enzyme [Polyangiaceae bacterium]